tara:strand:- start:6142 stop:6288 length:147 start_codon:yes stop_codon:yes gene_type:complete
MSPGGTVPAKVVKKPSKRSPIKMSPAVSNLPSTVVTPVGKITSLIKDV